LDQGLGRQRRGALFEPNEYGHVYTDCYDLCNGGFESQRALYDRHGQVLHEYLTQTVLPAVQQVQEKGLEEVFLKEMQRRWKNHQIMNRWLKRIFSYLDKCFLLQHNNSTLPQPLQEVGTHKFKTIIYNHCEPAMTQALLSVIDKERNGDDCDRSLAKSIVGLYENLGEYRRALEPAFLRATQQYCAQKRHQWQSTGGVAEYLVRAEDVVASEQLRVSELSPRSEWTLLRVVDYELLGQAQAQLLEHEASGCLRLLQHDKWEELNTMYRLLGRLEMYIHAAAMVEEEDEDEDIAGNTIRHRNSFNGSSSNSNNNRRLTNRELYQNKLAGDHTKGLQPMADLYQSHILKLGMDIVESRKARLMQPQQQQPPGETNNGKAPPSKKEKNEDSDFCKDLIALHDKFSNVNRETFCNHAYFCRALGESFGKIINMTNVGKFHNAELLSSFCDRVLRGMEKLNQVEVEQISTKIIQLFSYLTDKDIFAETYRVQLAKRLLTINNTTSSSLSSSGNDFEAEKSLISKLKAQCGTQFTSKMEGMLSDLELGAEQRGKFKSALAKEGKPKLDFGVQLLTVGHWPSYKSPENFAVTHEMQAGMEAYKSWYNQYHQNRKIAWVYTQGSANVTAIFANKTYDLTVSTLQAVVLNSFSGGRTLNFDDLKQQLNLEDEQMLRGLLHSLCCGKHRVIAKRSADGKASSSKKISSNDLFMANRKFTSKLRKIRIAMPTLASMEATSAASMAKVEEERKVVIEAAIVRIMKARKTSGHQDLVSEVLKQLTFFGAPNPRVIKRRIEDLIDREYLERSKDEANTYNYLA